MHTNCQFPRWTTYRHREVYERGEKCMHGYKIRLYLGTGIIRVPVPLKLLGF
jgi:hypothetical protein